MAVVRLLVLRVAAGGDERDIVIGAAGEDAVEQPVAELLEGQVRELRQDAGEPGEALVDATAAVLDEAVGDQEDGDAGVEGGDVVAARAGFAGAEEALGWAVEDLHGAVGVQQQRWRVPGGGPAQCAQSGVGLLGRLLDPG